MKNALFNLKLTKKAVMLLKKRKNCQGKRGGKFWLSPIEKNKLNVIKQKWSRNLKNSKNTVLSNLKLLKKGQKILQWVDLKCLVIPTVSKKCALHLDPLQVAIRPILLYLIDYYTKLTGEEKKGRSWREKETYYSWKNAASSPIWWAETIVLHLLIKTNFSSRGQFIFELMNFKNKKTKGCSNFEFKMILIKKKMFSNLRLTKNQIRLPKLS